MSKFKIATILIVFVTFFSSNNYSKDLPNFSELASSSSPAVVYINTVKTISNQSRSRGFNDPLYDDFLRKFFGEIPNRGQQRERQVYGTGSGFILSGDGYLLTNRHVIQGADEIIVSLSDRREFKAELIGSDERADLALLKVEATNLPTVKLGTSKELKVGEWVVAIGSPFQLNFSVTAGIVSAKGRSIPNGSDSTYVPFIQTDVAINPGNSGGPLFNLSGEVVGINSQILTRSGGYMGVAFAIPIDYAMNIVEQLKDKGYVARGWLGVSIQEVTRDLAEALGMEIPKGALISQVIEDSPAEKAGLLERDVIIEFDGANIFYQGDLPQTVGTVKPGSKVEAIVLRDGKQKVIQVEVGELSETNEVAKSPKKSQRSPLDIRVRNLSFEEKSQKDIIFGVIVEEVELNGLAAKIGIRKGDIITSIGKVKIRNVKEFLRSLEAVERDKTIDIGLMRNGNQRFLTLRLPK